MESSLVEQLNHTSLAAFRTLFTSLHSLPVQALEGVYQATFVGPWWLRSIAGPGLWPLGLGGWWGKTFDGRGQANNIIQRRGTLRLVLPIQVEERASLIDGRSVAAVIYPPGSRWPWPWVIDELRNFDETSLLGMTLVMKGPLSRLALPFLLEHQYHGTLKEA